MELVGHLRNTGGNEVLDITSSKHSYVIGMDLDGNLSSTTSDCMDSSTMIVTLCKVKLKKSGHWLMPCQDFPISLNGANVEFPMLLSQGSFVSVGGLNLQYSAELKPRINANGDDISPDVLSTPPPKPKRKALLSKTDINEPHGLFDESSIEDSAETAKHDLLHPSRFTESVEIQPNEISVKRQFITPEPTLKDMDHDELPDSNTNSSGDEEIETLLSVVPPDLVMSARSSLDENSEEIARSRIDRKIMALERQAERFHEPSHKKVESPQLIRRRVMPSQIDLAVLEDEKALQDLMDHMKTPEQIANTTTSYVLQTTTKLGGVLAIVEVDTIFKSIMVYANHNEKYLLQYIHLYNGVMGDLAEAEKLLRDLTIQMMFAVADCASELLIWLKILQFFQDQFEVVNCMVREKVCALLQGTMASFPLDEELHKIAMSVLANVAGVYVPENMTDKVPLREGTIDLVSVSVTTHGDNVSLIKPALHLLTNICTTYSCYAASILREVGSKHSKELETPLLLVMGVLGYTKQKVHKLLPEIQTKHGMNAKVQEYLNTLTRFFHDGDVDDIEEGNVQVSLSSLTQAVSLTIQYNKNNQHLKESTKETDTHHDLISKLLDGETELDGTSPKRNSRLLLDDEYAIPIDFESSFKSKSSANVVFTSNDSGDDSGDSGDDSDDENKSLQKKSTFNVYEEVDIVRALVKTGDQQVDNDLEQECNDESSDYVSKEEINPEINSNDRNSHMQQSMEHNIVCDTETMDIVSDYDNVVVPMCSSNEGKKLDEKGSLDGKSLDDADLQSNNMLKNCQNESTSQVTDDESPYTEMDFEENRTGKNESNDKVKDKNSDISIANPDNNNTQAAVPPSRVEENQKSIQNNIEEKIEGKSIKSYWAKLKDKAKRGFNPRKKKYDIQKFSSEGKDMHKYEVKETDMVQSIRVVKVRDSYSNEKEEIPFSEIHKGLDKIKESSVCLNEDMLPSAKMRTSQLFDNDVLSDNSTRKDSTEKEPLYAVVNKPKKAQQVIKEPDDSFKGQESQSSSDSEWAIVSLPKVPAQTAPETSITSSLSSSSSEESLGRVSSIDDFTVSLDATKVIGESVMDDEKSGQEKADFEKSGRNWKSLALELAGMDGVSSTGSDTESEGSFHSAEDHKPEASSDPSLDNPLPVMTASKVTLTLNVCKPNNQPNQPPERKMEVITDSHIYDDIQSSCIMVDTNRSSRENISVTAEKQVHHAENLEHLDQLHRASVTDVDDGLYIDQVYESYEDDGLNKDSQSSCQQSETNQTITEKLEKENSVSIDHVYESFEDGNAKSSKSSSSRWGKFKAIMQKKRKYSIDGNKQVNQDETDLTKRPPIQTTQISFRSSLFHAKSMGNLSIKMKDSKDSGLNEEEKSFGALSKQKSISTNSLATSAKSRWKIFKRKMKKTDHSSVLQTSMNNDNTSPSPDKAPTDSVSSDSTDSPQSLQNETTSQLEKSVSCADLQNYTQEGSLEHSKPSTASLFDYFYENNQSAYKAGRNRETRRFSLFTSTPKQSGSPSFSKRNVEYPSEDDSDEDIDANRDPRFKRTFSWLKRTRINKSEPDDGGNKNHNNNPSVKDSYGSSTTEMLDDVELWEASDQHKPLTEEKEAEICEGNIHETSMSASFNQAPNQEQGTLAPIKQSGNWHIADIPDKIGPKTDNKPIHKEVVSNGNSQSIENSLEVPMEGTRYSYPRSLLTPSPITTKVDVETLRQQGIVIPGTQQTKQSTVQGDNVQDLCSKNDSNPLNDDHSSIEDEDWYPHGQAEDRSSLEEEDWYPEGAEIVSSDEDEKRALQRSWKQVMGELEVKHGVEEV